MSDFTARSLGNLVGVHPRLVELAKEITQVFDCSVLDGLRTEAQQELDVQGHLSETMASKHLIQPDGFGHALDLAPTPQQWDASPPADLTKYQVECIAFLFYVKGYARARGLAVRIGADWNGNNLWQDNSFNDLDHVELADDNEPASPLPPLQGLV